MGRSWVGFQPLHKPVPGHTVRVDDEFAMGIGDAAVVALLTTAAGLSEWLARPTAFTLQRGGTIDLADADGAYGASYTLVDIPRRVVIVTERHGEIDIRLDLAAQPSRLAVGISRFLADTEDAQVASTRLDEVIARLKARCSDGA